MREASRFLTAAWRGQGALYLAAGLACILDRSAVIRILEGWRTSLGSRCDVDQVAAIPAAAKTFWTTFSLARRQPPARPRLAD
eukprot:7402462-Pyramimonas_sp.AAC.1